MSESDFCDILHRPYYKNCFPKICKKCQKIFRDRKEYLELTHEVTKGTYQGTQTKVLELRNCFCGNTLTTRFVDLRDHSIEGKRRRQLFSNKIKRKEA